ncbi:MAG: hypothetical protein IPM69_05865 [Ignavibacteria bacterium]|nr:hypothetical protein [Ignavibacteria bacterium]
MNDSPNLIFTQRSSPNIQTIHGIIVCIPFFYLIVCVVVSEPLSIPGNLVLFMLMLSVTSLPAMFRRHVMRVEFDDKHNQLIITYPKYFFFRHDVRIEYEATGFIAFNDLGVLKDTPTSLSHLKFYNKRTYIAQITTKLTSWKRDWQSEDLEKMHAKLKTFAKEYKDSPGLI